MAVYAVAHFKIFNTIVYFLTCISQMLRRFSRSTQSFALGPREATINIIDLLKCDCGESEVHCSHEGYCAQTTDVNNQLLSYFRVSLIIDKFFNVCTVNKIQEEMTMLLNSNCCSKLKANSTFCYFWIGYNALDTNLSPFNIVPCALFDGKSDVACDKISNISMNLDTANRKRYVSECSDDSIICFLGESGDMDECTNLKICLEDAKSEDDITLQGKLIVNSGTQKYTGIEHNKKKVNFNLNPKVHVMRTWDFAYRKARKGEWETYARDRARFQQRIIRTALIIEPILKTEHRNRVFAERCSGTTEILKNKFDES